MRHTGLWFSAPALRRLRPFDPPGANWKRCAEALRNVSGPSHPARPQEARRGEVMAHDVVGWKLPQRGGDQGHHPPDGRRRGPQHPLPSRTPVEPLTLAERWRQGADRHQVDRRRERAEEERKGRAHDRLGDPLGPVSGPDLGLDHLFEVAHERRVVLGPRALRNAAGEQEGRLRRRVRSSSVVECVRWGGARRPSSLFAIRARALSRARILHPLLAARQ
jgi:hypothetical protein